MHMWANVHELFSGWAEGEVRPLRDADALKQKFDRLANTNKRTGDPKCPLAFRQSKSIARSIPSRVQAATLGAGSKSELEENYGTAGSGSRGADGGGSSSGSNGRGRRSRL